MIRDRVERPLLRLAARVLERWTAAVEARLDTDESITDPVAPPTPATFDSPSEPPADWLEHATPTPPEHWLEMVREHAPQLLDEQSVDLIEWQTAERPAASVDVETRPLTRAPRLPITTPPAPRRTRPLRLINPAVRTEAPRIQTRQRPSVKHQPVALREQESLPAELGRPSFVRSDGDASSAPDIPLHSQQKAASIHPPMRSTESPHQPSALRTAPLRSGVARPRVRMVQSAGMEANQPTWQERNVTPHSASLSVPTLRSIASEGIPSGDTVYSPNQWPELLSEPPAADEERNREVRRRERLDAEQRGSGSYSWNE